MLPMGTIITACMLVCIAFANRLPSGALNAVVPAAGLKIVGLISVTAGLWNVLWYASRHITQFWGQMALSSGLLLCALGILLMSPDSGIGQRLEKARHIMVFALAIFAACYAWTIYQL